MCMGPGPPPLVLLILGTIHVGDDVTVITVLP